MALVTLLAPTSEFTGKGLPCWDAGCWDVPAHSLSHCHHTSLSQASSARAGVTRGGPHLGERFACALIVCVQRSVFTTPWRGERSEEERKERGGRPSRDTRRRSLRLVESFGRCWRGGRARPDPHRPKLVQVVRPPSGGTAPVNDADGGVGGHTCSHAASPSLLSRGSFVHATSCTHLGQR